MKRFFIVLAMLALLNSTFTSCKKDAVTTSSPITLVGKWKLISSIEKKNGVVTSTYTGLPTDYIDFKVNGLVEDSQNGVITQEGSYSISGNTVTVAGNMLYTLTLNATNCTMIHTEVQAGVTIDMITNLQK